MREKIGLVLTAGGARGAYQAGVLKRLGEIKALRGSTSPFAIVTGASVGAINSVMIAAGSDDFNTTTVTLANLWSNLRTSNVFRTDLRSLGLGATRWIRDLSFGGIIGGGRAQSLLNASPLQKMLTDQVPWSGIGANIRRGNLYALGIATTSYFSGKSVTFVQGQPGHPMWQKHRKVSVATDIAVAHVSASCAIPVLFSPVPIVTPQGRFFFGDGGLRLVAPCSSAIRLGSQRLLAIGIRSQKAAEARLNAEMMHAAPDGGSAAMKEPPMAQVLGILLNAIFLDHLDTDLEHLERMNNLLKGFGTTAEDDAPMKDLTESIRPIQAGAIYPSTDLALVAHDYRNRMPTALRYLMEGLGDSKAQSADLMSYLLFDKGYTKTLVDIGYQDAHRDIDRLAALILDDKASPA